MKVLRPILCLVLVAGLAAGCTVTTGEASKHPPLLVNLTAGPEDLHSAFMALAFATFAVEDRPVTVFLNVRAPVLASRQTHDSVCMAGKPSVREQLTTLMQAGAKVLVCPTCAELLHVAAGDLL
ncbi:MAG: hypothetical protein MUE73_20750, partial [Planctomycetes bacterium]|nr:hypothetical protein [Planctomycetota bacterium]